MAVVGVGLYVKGSMEAVSLYCEAFGMELGYHVIRQDGMGYYHSELNRKGEPALSVVEAEHTPGANPVQLGITFESRPALEKAYALLVEGGEVEMPPQQLPWSPWAACGTGSACAGSSACPSISPGMILCRRCEP